MKEQTGKGILVAIDGSDYAFHTVHYISRIPSFKEIEIHLFTVLTTIPGPCLDLQREPVFRGKAAEILAWESRQRQECYWYMERAKQVLLNAGFSPGSVTTELHEMERGVARDIIKESGKGYAALVAGKRGPGGVKQLVLGGIATKLLQKVSSVSPYQEVRKPDKVKISILPPPRTIPGDYMFTVRAVGKQDQTDMDLRVTVKRSTVWGWVGIGIVVVIIASLVGIFVKLGRR